MNELQRSVTLWKLFRKETTDPQTFYHFLAEDTVGQMARYMPPAGRVVLDVGGGPGYTAEAFEKAGARCFTVDPDPAELVLHGRTARSAVVADGQLLPFEGASADAIYSSNVLEHVRRPWDLLVELIRIIRPGGIIFLCFTNWYSPFGGHETSPWHYLGGEWAVQRYERHYGRPPKNRYGESLFRLHIGTVLGWLRARPDVELIDAYPRYYPSITRPLVAVPGLRELLTWNVAIVLSRR